MSRTRIYLAAPLFSAAERTFNRTLADTLRKRMPGCTVNLPQEYAASIKGKAGFVENMFEYCISSIDNADIVLAILDGSDTDAGTCIELGYAYARKKHIIGIRTDFRSSEDRGVNLMVSKACNHLIWLADSSVTMDQIVSETIHALHDLP